MEVEAEIVETEFAQNGLLETPETYGPPSPVSRPQTPEQDDPLNHDEPSSVLASRILSAPHNSSPPPSVAGSRRYSMSRRPSNLGFHVESVSAHRGSLSPNHLVSPKGDTAPTMDPSADPTTTPPTPRRSTRPRRSVTPFGEDAPPPIPTVVPPLPAMSLRTPSPSPNQRKLRRSRSASPGKSEEIIPRPASPTPNPFLPQEDGLPGPSKPRRSTRTPSPAPKRRKRSRSRSRSPEKTETEDEYLRRTVGSLSPDSTMTLGRLGRLLPSMRASPTRNLYPPLDLTSLAIPTPSPQSPTRVLASSTRLGTPGKAQVSGSTQTPSRMPVQEAVARGHISPMKGVQLLGIPAKTGASSSQGRPQSNALNVQSHESPTRMLSRQPTGGSDVFDISSLTSPTRGQSPTRVLASSSTPRQDSKGKVPMPGGTQSPAKRYPAQLAASFPRPGIAAPSFTSSPSKTSKVRGSSVEPKPSVKAPFPKPRQASAEPHLSSPFKTLTSTMPNRSTLPFPLIPSSSQGFAAIPEESTTTQPKLPSWPKDSTAGTGSKQATSRIPRRNAKPYSRPTTSNVTGRAQNQPRHIQHAESSQTSLPGPSSDGPNNAYSPQKKDRVDTAPASAIPSPLKRKREELSTPTKLTGSGKVPIVLVPHSPYSSRNHGRVPSSPSKPSRFNVPEEQPLPKRSSSVPHGHERPPPIASIDEGSQPSGPRRTGRLRKQAQPVGSDTLGAFPSTSIRQPGRRKPSSQTQASLSSDPFVRMSAVALRSLTSDNTTKNQHYLIARLEQEIVLRNGARPESPPVKVKTIVQKEEEEKTIRRQERAKRRSRRSDGAFSDEENGEPVSALDLDGPPPRRHQLGAGEEEEYETPERPLAKKRKIHDHEGDEKRVTWDHGLFTTTVLDDITPGTRARTKDPPKQKGCIGRNAQLDSLGNLCDAEIPLASLVEETIVVKKFVYENDEVQEPTVEVVPAAKNTRSRSKKTKS